MITITATMTTTPKIVLRTCANGGNLPYTPTIAVDFDQTLCNSDFPACGPAKDNAKEALIFFRSLGFRILIWSCRTCHWNYDTFGGDPTQPTLERDNVKLMVAMLEENGIPFDEVDDGSRGKPTADYYIDDKGVRFENNWLEIMKFIGERTNVTH